MPNPQSTIRRGASNLRRPPQTFAKGTGLQPSEAAFKYLKGGLKYLVGANLATNTNNYCLRDINSLDGGGTNEVGNSGGETCTVTSGSDATVSVFPKCLMKSRPCHRGRKRAVYYRAANGQKMHDAGGQWVIFTAGNGHRRAVNFRVAEVTKPRSMDGTPAEERRRCAQRDH